MDANFLNLHIDKARKTHDDKQLYLITLFMKQTLNLVNYLLLTLKCNSFSKFKFLLNDGYLVFWFNFNLAVHTSDLKSDGTDVGNFIRLNAHVPSE